MMLFSDEEDTVEKNEKKTESREDLKLKKFIFCIIIRIFYLIYCESMSVLNVIWAEFLYRPIFNLLVVFLAIFGGNMGIAIILLTLLVRLLLLRNSMAGANMSKGMSSIQPKMEEIQEKYKDDPKKLSEETMKLLKKEGAGPMK